MMDLSKASYQCVKYALLILIIDRTDLQIMDIFLIFSDMVQPVFKTAPGQISNFQLINRSQNYF